MGKAIKLADSGKETRALQVYIKAMSLARNRTEKKKVLLKVVDLCERKLKDYQCALNSYSELLVFAENNKERENYHFNMGTIYFVFLQDYENALIQFSEVTELCEDPLVCLEAKIKISHSYFYKKEYKQAINEVEDLNKNQKQQNKVIDKTKYIQAAILHAQALMGLEKYEDATVPLREALGTFPEESNRLKLPIILSVAYRENRMLKEAIDVLKNFKNHTQDVSSQAYAEAQISKLEKRLELQPGGPTGKRIRR
ncbi:MAG: hypothetical protein M9899_01240 [Bdellovibrionaceae bacterium]|nr:hypothetical protein [Pseudobdellovibrionaceae bacterium]